MATPKPPTCPKCTTDQGSAPVPVTMEVIGIGTDSAAIRTTYQCPQCHRTTETVTKREPKTD